MRYMISAGEASGDLHASHLIESLRKVDQQAEFFFLGGDRMEASAGRSPVVHYRDMAFMGFVDVVLHLDKVMKNLATAKRILRENAIDCLILVDYPSFNLKVAETAVKLGIPVYYYISPKVWAWKEHRVKTIKKLVKRMFSILPFEVDYYRNWHNYDVEYVGNPSLAEVDEKLRRLPSEGSFRKAHGLGSEPIIALLPGSRVAEIKANLPLMVEAAKQFPGYRGVVARISSVDFAIYDRLAPGLSSVTDLTFELLAFSTAALVTSGTATLETALIGTPQVVAFRWNGSKMTYYLFRRILKVDYVSLPNLIAGHEIVKELLLHQCTSENLAKELKKILPGESCRAIQLHDYAEMRSRMGKSIAPDVTAANIYDDLKSMKERVTLSQVSSQSK